MDAIKEALESLKSIRAETSTILTEAQEGGGESDYSRVKAISGGKDAVIARLDENIAKMNELMATVERLEQESSRSEQMRKVDEFMNAPARNPRVSGHAAPGADGEKSLGTRFIEDANYAPIFRKGVGYYQTEMSLHELDRAKALFQTTSGYPPFVMRTGDVVPLAHRPVQVLQAIRQTPTTQSSIRFVEQTVRTPAADMGIAEGTPYNEATLNYAERTVPVVKRGVYIPVTQEQIEDVDGVQMLVDMDLVEMLMEDIDNQIINGTGTGESLQGFLNLTGRRQITRAADTAVMSAINAGITEVEVEGRARPSHVLMNSRDWADLLQTQTTNGLYLLGSGQDDVVQRLWGLPVLKVDSLARGTGVVVDMRYVQIFDRRDVTTKMSDRSAVNIPAGQGASVANTIPTGQFNIYADVRLSLVTRRPAAVCQITGL